MNGSRSTPPRSGDTSSLDALSRTIEGLEARIEGLMGTAGRETRPRMRSEADPYRDRVAERDVRSTPRDLRADPLAEIRQRQRALEASREQPPYRATERAAPLQSRAETVIPDYRAPEPRMRAPAAAAPIAAAPAVPDAAMKEIAQALVNLRQELKQDISAGVSREMNSLRSEIRSMKVVAEDQRFAEDMREDMARIAESINQLGRQPGLPHDAEGLRVEFEELRSLMDGLAREESVQRMDSRWSGVEHKLQSVDTISLQEELVSLAYRLDDIKSQLGSMSASPAIQALEDKLITIASAMEQLGTRMQPNDHAIAEQFAGLDLRLDEISRAIVAGSRGSTSADPSMLARLENRISGLAEQIDLMGHAAMNRPDPVAGLGSRLEMLSARIEELSNVEAAGRLEERLDQLSMLMERSQTAAPAPELTGYLADISRKIDALDQGSVNNVLGERLDYLARRIDSMNFAAPVAAPMFDDSAFLRLEDRLSDIAARLDETVSAPAGNDSALRALEDQIAHLSVLVSEPRHDTIGLSPQFESRMAALEDYMTTNDEYIIEAARQAAEAVVEAYSRNGAMQGMAPAAAAADMSALSALADDLRHLEDLSRSSEERTHRTFEALHDTLVQIAGRLDQMDSRSHGPDTYVQPAPVQERAMPKAAQPVFAQAFAEPERIDDYAMADAPFEDHDFEDDLAAYPPRDHGRTTSERAAASPVIRTHAAVTAAIDEEIAQAVQAVSDEKPIAAHKTSLLAGLSKRFLPGRKEQLPAKIERTLIDPTPSISPADYLPHDQANELLEPGSGAPDIKKILERVRANQGAAAQRPAGAGVTEDDRADYIAAARRAAQAAAQEVDPSQRLAPKKESGKGLAGTFAQHRRPILMAVGAILLVIMAMPLVNTLTRGESAPPAIEATSDAPTTDTKDPVLNTQAIPDPNAADLSTQTATPASSDKAAGATDGDTSLAQPEQATPETTDHLTADRSLSGGEDSPALTPSEGVAKDQDPAGFVAKSEPDATVTAPATADVATLAIPDAIGPKSLTDAAKGGDPLALFEIGARYTEGRGTTADLAEAAKFYEAAAAKGFAPAQYRIANLYEKGTGVERDLVKAKDFYQQAADKGNASAMHNLAVLFATGTNGTPDYDSAVKWFIKAADLGVSDSQFNLAILFARGNGVPQNLEESYKWFAIAAKDGDKDAAQKRDEVANAMRPEQLEKARATVDLWKPQPLNPEANSVTLPDEWVGKGLKTASVDMKKAIRNIQAILNNNGFDAGTPDGEMGKKTVTAIKAFQKANNMEPNGKITDDLVKALLARNK